MTVAVFIQYQLDPQAAARSSAMSKRARPRSGPAGRENLAQAQPRALILCEQRSFLRQVAPPA